MSDITKIREVREKDGGDWEEWPYPTTTITSRVRGALRGAVLAKADVSDFPGCAVTIEESTVSGGWSEFTQEDEYTFRVLVNDVQYWTSSDYPSNALDGFLKWADAKPAPSPGLPPV